MDRGPIHVLIPRIRQVSTGGVIVIAMDEVRRARGEVTKHGAVSRLEASRRGATTVAEAFRSAITRKTFANRLGMHTTTVRRWEALGIVHPQQKEVLGIPTMVFSEKDVERGRAIVALLGAHQGTMSLKQAALVIDEQGEPEATRKTGRKGRKGRNR